ncbi:hypothetical protein B0T22DRAFT_448714 [Podospora appendiculata]|uniref:Uncharacterized protein n=1 Tax=Podospora appendiculata TaxID=314037 RepID=A0AAE1CFY6_9PEZI|nr:hypothetical protein B0T22DRAFT_448714 [Podospora appendiculata]
MARVISEYPHPLHLVLLTGLGRAIAAIFLSVGASKRSPPRMSLQSEELLRNCHDRLRQQESEVLMAGSKANNYT